MKTVVVDVKSDWSSKINWAQIIGVVAMAGVWLGFDLSAGDQAMIVSGILAVQAAITIIVRTFFTTAITSSSAKKI